MVFVMRRLQPAAAAVARSVGSSSARASLVGRHAGAKLAAVQLVPTHGFGGSRAFSSSPVTSFVQEDRVVAASPAEALEQVAEAAATIDPKTIADLGYSLSDLAIRSLDIVHVTTGLPWWATIVAATVVVRSAVFPITLKSLRNSAKMKLFQPEMEKLKAEMDANPTRDPESMKTFQTKYKALMAKHGVNPLASFFTPFTQIPVFLGFFWGLQKIGEYIPEYAQGGALWFPDLTAADPTLALPVISSALMALSVEMNGDAMPGEYKDRVKFGMRAFAVAMVPLTMNFSSGVFVYWVTSNTFTLVQTAATRVPAVRRALNLPLEQQVKVLTAASPGSGSEPVSPFQAAVSRAKQNATIQTHVNKPGKKKN